MEPDEDERIALRHRFEEFGRSRDPAIRDELVSAHLVLAERLARRFDRRGIPVDDLIQVASLALVNAVERFDFERGLEFTTFATPTIVGELKRHFRDKGWAVRVPRRMQELHVRINALVGELTQREGRSPTIAELAIAARTSPEEVLEAMEAAQAYRSASFDDDPDGDGPSRSGGDRFGDDDAELFRVEDRLLVERLLGTLPPREQLLVRLRFYEEMTQAEIADRLDISQMHVSRLLARCLDSFRTRLETESIAGADDVRAAQDQR